MDSTSIKGLGHLYSYLNSATTILNQYEGSLLFAHFIKNYFSKNKKYGGRDRKQISHLCYAFFRLGKSYASYPVEERILKGLSLSTPPPNEKWQEVFLQYHLPQTEPDRIFAFEEILSKEIDCAAFEQAHLIQPDLFLRIRPGCQNQVMKKLSAANEAISIQGNCLRLPNSFKLDDLISMNREAVVQDYNSQKVGDLLQRFATETENADNKISVWDCCAASGGKTMLAKDLLPKARMTASDLRPSIVTNLRKRLQQAQINQVELLVADATTINPQKQFDLIMADVPCSGSGTWARTPEQLIFFDEKQVAVYASLQQKILNNVLRFLKPGGYLLYITCSVFEKENEAQVKYVLEKGFAVIDQQILKGYDKKADTMFAALLKKNM